MVFDTCADVAGFGLEEDGHDELNQTELKRGVSDMAKNVKASHPASDLR